MRNGVLLLSFVLVLGLGCYAEESKGLGELWRDFFGEMWALDLLGESMRERVLYFWSLQYSFYYCEKVYILLLLSSFDLLLGIFLRLEKNVEIGWKM
jgi:hypothetical protein